MVLGIALGLALALAVGGLSQGEVNGQPLCVGCSTTEGGRVALSGSSSCTGTLYTGWDFEVSPADAGFTGVPTASSAMTICRTYWGYGIHVGTVTIQGLQPRTAYAWQARRSSGAWSRFPADGGVAFITGDEPPYHLALVSGPAALTSTVCSQLTVELRNGSDVAVPGAGGNVDLRGVSFYGNAACTSGVTSVPLDAAGRATVWVREIATTTAKTLYFDRADAVVLKLTLPVNPGPAMALKVPSQSPLVGACAASTVGTSDDAGNLSPVDGGRSVSVGSPNAGVSFYDKSNCAGPGPSLSIATGASSVAFYWSSTQLGLVDITATSAGLPAFTAQQRVQANLTFQTAVQMLRPNACSSAVTVRTENGSGQAYVVGATPPLVLSGTGLSFFSDATCATAAPAVPVSTGSGTFYLRSTNGTAVRIDGGTLIRSVSQNITMLPDPPAKAAFVTPPHTVLQGYCSPATVVAVTDTWGNPSPPMVPPAFMLTSSSVTLRYFSDAQCTQPLIGNATVTDGGAGVTVYWRDGTVGSPMLNASTSGFPPVSQTELVTADNAALHAQFVDQVPMAGVNDCVPLTVELESDAGVATAAPLDIAGVLGADAPEVTFFADPGCSVPSPTLGIFAGDTRGTAFARATAPLTAFVGWTTSEAVSPALQVIVFANPDGGTGGSGGGAGGGSGTSGGSGTAGGSGTGGGTGNMAGGGTATAGGDALGTRTFGVGFSCGQAGDAFLLAALLALLRTRRGRRGASG